MSVLQDAERYLQLHQANLESPDDPNELLAGLVKHFLKYGLQNKLVSENHQLRAKIIELEASISEANGRALVLASQNNQLTKALECQTSSLRSTRSMAQQRQPSPEILTDHRLEDPGFIPCRDERCRDLSIHATGECDETAGRGPSKRRKRGQANV
jgi:hypothetical protein